MKEKEIIIYKINTCLKSFDIISLNAIYQAIKNLSDKKANVCLLVPSLTNIVCNNTFCIQEG